MQQSWQGTREEEAIAVQARTGFSVGLLEGLSWFGFVTILAVAPIAPDRVSDRDNLHHYLQVLS